LLGDAGADLLVELLDLVELCGAGVLTAGLLVANLVGLGDEFLAALLGGRLGVLLGEGDVDLGLDGVLGMLAGARAQWIQEAYQTLHGGLVRLLSLCKVRLEGILIRLLGASGLLRLVRRRGSSRSRSLGHLVR
jgi:hypothetical protein